MKRLLFLTMLMSLSLVVAACTTPNDKNATEPNTPIEDNQNNSNKSDDNQTTTDDGVEDNANENENNGDEASRMDQLPYTEFELEVEYANDQEYEIELEKKKDGTIKAKIEDELNNVNLEGSEAFDELYPLVEKMTVTQGTSKEDAIQEALKVFNLADDYTEFELEITFKDGTEIEFKDRK